MKNIAHAKENSAPRVATRKIIWYEKNSLPGWFVESIVKPMRNWKKPPPMKLKIFKPAMADPEISRGNRVTGIVRKMQVTP